MPILEVGMLANRFNRESRKSRKFNLSQQTTSERGRTPRLSWAKSPCNTATSHRSPSFRNISSMFISARPS